MAPKWSGHRDPGLPLHRRRHMGLPADPGCQTIGRGRVGFGDLHLGARPAASQRTLGEVTGEEGLARTVFATDGLETAEPPDTSSSSASSAGPKWSSPTASRSNPLAGTVRGVGRRSPHDGAGENGLNHACHVTLLLASLQCARHQ